MELPDSTKNEKITMVEILNTKNIVAVTAMANVIKKLTNVMSAGKVLVAHRTTASPGLVVRRDFW